MAAVPITAAGTPLYDAVMAEIAKIQETIKTANADKKVTFQELFFIVSQAITGLVAITREFTDTPSATRRTLVIDAIQYLYDTTIKPLDLPGIPNLIEPAVDSIFGQILAPAIGGIYDSVNALFERLFAAPDPDAPAPVEPTDPVDPGHHFLKGVTSAGDIATASRDAIAAYSG